MNVGIHEMALRKMFGEYEITNRYYKNDMVAIRDHVSLDNGLGKTGKRWKSIMLYFWIAALI